MQAETSNGVPSVQLQQAKNAIQRGVEFGVAYMILLDTVEEREQLKDWYVREPGVPVISKTVVSRAEDAILYPTSPQKSSREMGYSPSGEECTNCKGMRVRRNGTCLVCDDCGTTSGCS